MRYRFFLAFSFLICAFAHAAPVDEQVALDPRVPPTISEAEKCLDSVIRNAMPDWPKKALRAGTIGWVLVRYDLDGSGLAQNAVIEISAPNEVFEQSALLTVKRSKYKPGISKAGCKTLIVYS